MLARSLLICASIALALPAGAKTKVFKADQFAADLVTAANEVKGVTLATQAGFVKGEAFGQLYVPDAADYPFTILGVDIILAAPPNAPEATTHAVIEIWNDPVGSATQAGPTSASPAFTISTTDLFNPGTGGLGFPLQGNTALAIDFDYENPENHPPQITSGVVRVVVRYSQDSQDLSTEWGTFQCTKFAELGVCGCQPVGALFDQTSTPNRNIIHYIEPVGTCGGGANKWAFMETIGVTGDVILRLRAKVPESGCQPSCGGAVCGSDGCGGSCGSCAVGEVCELGACAPECIQDCEGKVCGADGCGGSCGTCAAGESCVAFQCEADACEPDCGEKACGDDGCGGSCGTCVAGESCVAFQCEADACEPDCAGKACGDDGCGGSCGACSAGEACEDFQCEAEPCDPDCAGMACGDDGCGGSCGACSAGESCDGGACVADAPLLEVSGISPAFGFSDAETEVSVTGEGFVPGMTVKLGGTNLGSVQVIGTQLIDATVPDGLEVGTYALIVVTPDARSATLADAFEVRVRPADGALCGDGQCTGGKSCVTCPEDCGPCESGEDTQEPVGDTQDSGAPAAIGAASDGGCGVAGGDRWSPLAALLLVLALVLIRSRARERA